MNLRWKIDPLDDRYDTVTILETPEEWRGKGFLGLFAGVGAHSYTYPAWSLSLDLHGTDRSRDLEPIKVPREDTLRVHRALLALEAWHRTGQKVVEEVVYGEFPKEVGK